MANNKLSREEFRKKVFERDNYTCVVPGCGKPADEAHHIIERKLWIDIKKKEGYFLDNGCSLCNECHQLAERNVFPPQSCRIWSGITNRILPKGWDYNKDYNKWGEELKFPEFEFFSYPTTWYLYFSPSIASDNKRNVHPNLSHTLKVPGILTIKMDGSNVKICKKYVAARNGHQANHPSFDLLKTIHAQISHLIPENLYIYGEWLYAKHSIKYEKDLKLNSYFQCFGIYDTDTHIWLDWKKVVEICNIIGLNTVPILKETFYENEWEMVKDITELGERVIKKGHEGVVWRSQLSYHFNDFGKYTLKYVRPNHVQTDKHWMFQNIEKNESENLF